MKMKGGEKKRPKGELSKKLNAKKKKRGGKKKKRDSQKKNESKKQNAQKQRKKERMSWQNWTRFPKDKENANRRSNAGKKKNADNERKNVAGAMPVRRDGVLAADLIEREEIGIVTVRSHPDKIAGEVVAALTEVIVLLMATVVSDVAVTEVMMVKVVSDVAVTEVNVMVVLDVSTVAIVVVVETEKTRLMSGDALVKVRDRNVTVEEDFPAETTAETTAERTAVRAAETNPKVAGGEVPLALVMAIAKAPDVLNVAANVRVV